MQDSNRVNQLPMEKHNEQSPSWWFVLVFAVARRAVTLTSSTICGVTDNTPPYESIMVIVQCHSVTTLLKS